MKIECVKSNFQEVVSIVEKISGKNLPLAALNAVLLETNKNSVILKATNLDVGVEVIVPCKVFKEGVVAISGVVLSRFLSSLGQNDDKIVFELIDSTIHIGTTKNSTLLRTQVTEDFPTIPHIPEKEAYIFTINSQILSQACKSVVYAVAITDVKPELASIALYPEKTNLTLVATDSFRLSERVVPIISGLDAPEKPFLLPHKSAIDLLRILEGIDETVQVLVGENQIAFSVGTVYFTSRVVDGVFPAYQQIIPKKSSTEATVLVADFLQALKLATVFSDKFNQVTLTLVPKDGVFEVIAKNQDAGETTTNVDAAISGDAVSASFNARYILDCLPHITQDSLTVSLNGKDKPLMIRGVGGNTFTYLVMPLNR